MSPGLLLKRVLFLTVECTIKAAFAAASFLGIRSLQFLDVTLIEYLKFTR